MYGFDLVGQNDCYQIVGTGPGVAVDHDGHPGGKDDAAGGHTDDAQYHGRVSVNIVAEEKSEKINDRTAAEGTDDCAGFYIALGRQKHEPHQDAEDNHMDGSDGQAEYTGQSLDKYSECIGAELGNEKKSHAQMGDDQADEQN